MKKHQNASCEDQCSEDLDSRYHSSWGYLNQKLLDYQPPQSPEPLALESRNLNDNSESTNGESKRRAPRCFVFNEMDSDVSSNHTNNGVTSTTNIHNSIPYNNHSPKRKKSDNNTKQQFEEANTTVTTVTTVTTPIKEETSPQVTQV